MKWEKEILKIKGLGEIRELERGACHDWINQN